MKTKKIEKWLLLEQSGELSPGRLRRLGRELDASEHARRFRAELNVLSGSIHAPDDEPSPWAVARIDARLRAEKQQFVPLSRILKPVLALTAGLFLMLNVWNFHGEPVSSSSAAVIAAAEVDVWSDPFEEDLSRLEYLIGTISGASLDIMEM